MTVNAAGATVSEQIVYSQKFRETYKQPTVTPKVGSIGLGTIKGDIGTPKKNHYITVTDGMNENE